MPSQGRNILSQESRNSCPSSQKRSVRSPQMRKEILRNKYLNAQALRKFR